MVDEGLLKQKQVEIYDLIALKQTIENTRDALQQLAVLGKSSATTLERTLYLSYFIHVESNRIFQQWQEVFKVTESAVNGESVFECPESQSAEITF